MQKNYKTVIITNENIKEFEKCRQHLKIEVFNTEDLLKNKYNLDDYRFCIYYGSNLWKIEFLDLYE